MQKRNQKNNQRHSMNRKHSDAITTIQNGSSRRNSAKKTSKNSGINEIKQHNPFIITRTAVVADAVETGRKLMLLRFFFNASRREVAKLAGWNHMLVWRIEAGKVSSNSIAEFAKKYVSALYAKVPEKFDISNSLTWKTYT